jgi:signal transduction histidine kinase
MTWLRVVHIACCFSYLTIGWYLQWRAPQRMVAALLAAIAATWGVWSGTLIVLHDPDATPLQAALGYDLGVIGWAGIGSLALASALGFTGRSHLLAKRSVRMALVVPPLVVLLAQWNGLLATSYVRHAWGWGYVWARSPIVWGFYAYYASYVSVALYLVVTHGYRSRQRRIRKYMGLMAMTGSLALLGGSVTDVVLPWLDYHAIPNIAPAFLAVFFVGLTIAVVRFRAFELTPENASSEILAAMRDGVLLVDRHGVIIDGNRAAHELLGESILRRRHVGELVGTTVDARNIARGERELLVTSSAVSDPHGVALGSVCLLRDVTEQKQAAAALRELEEQLEIRVAQRTRELDAANHEIARALAIRGALSAIVDSIHRADSAREIGEGVADSLAHAFALAAHCRVILDDESYAPPGFVAVAHPTVYEVRASGTVRGAIEIHGDGLSAELEMPRVAVEIGLALESISLRTAIAQADRLASVGELAAGVAHEINNPLTYLSLGLTQIDRQLGQPTFDVELVRTRIAQTLDASQRIARVVRELGAFARDADEVRPVRIRDAMSAAIAIARHQLEHRARLVIALDTEAVVQGDAGRITQVFVNLLVNAAQAIPEGSADANTITVTSKDEADQIMVSVSDTGRGIPPDALGRIFDPFFTTKNVGEGTGLGLAISFKIVRSLGGTINVTSIHGQGARFDVRFPRRTDLLARSLTPRPFVRTGGKRILIVDDDPLVARSLGEVLAAHEVTYAGSGASARDLLQRGENFDLLICDLMMPVMGGAELYTWVGEHRDDLRDRFLFMTGGAFSPEMKAFSLAHGDRLITKPFDAMTIERAIALVLARP